MVGHSHMVALGRALTAEAESGLRPRDTGIHVQRIQLLNNPALSPPVTPEGLAPALAQAVAQPGLAGIVAVIGGNTHNSLALLNPAEPFDLVVPDAPDRPLDPAARLMPWGLACRMIASHSAEHLALFEALAAKGLPLILIEPPPPIPSEDHIRAHPGPFATGIAAVGISPAILRWKLWRAQSAVWRDACRRLGAHFLPVPPDTMDDDGMLRPAYWNPDPTHANAAYGARVLADLRAHLRTGGVTA